MKYLLLQKLASLATVVQMWRLQDEVLSLADSSLHTRVKSVYLVNGELDGSVAPLSESEAVMTRIAGQTASVESYELPGAGHNILFEKEEIGAAALVASKILNERQ